jgi:hypothetical protein
MKNSLMVVGIGLKMEMLFYGLVKKMDGVIYIALAKMESRKHLLPKANTMSCK